MVFLPSTTRIETKNNDCQQGHLQPISRLHRRQQSVIDLLCRSLIEKHIEDVSGHLADVLAAVHGPTMAMNLSPACGVVIAINLAYFGLPRFRYREQISIQASKDFEDFKVPKPDGNIENWTEYKTLRALATLGDGGEKDQARIDIEKKEIVWFNTLWGRLYLWFFSSHVDKYSSLLFGLLAGVMLIFATGLAIKWPFLDTLGDLNEYITSTNFYGDTLWGLIVFAFLPIIFVLVGNKIVNDAKALTKEQAASLREKLGEKAGQADKPDDVWFERD